MGYSLLAAPIAAYPLAAIIHVLFLPTIAIGPLWVFSWIGIFIVFALSQPGIEKRIKRKNRPGRGYIPSSGTGQASISGRDVRSQRSFVSVVIAKWGDYGISEKVSTEAK